MTIRFSYVKLVRDHESGCVFGVSLSLAVVAIGILFSNLLNTISLGCRNEISSNEDEFDLSFLNDEITFIHRVLDREKESSDEYSV